MIDFGFIGAGNMGGALAVATARAVGSKKVAVADKNAVASAHLSAAIGCPVFDNEKMAKNARFLFLGVKPQFAEGLAGEIREILAERERVILVSMMAGVKIEKVRALFGDLPVIRIMPNTSVAIGKGVVAYVPDGITEEEEKEFKAAMASAGTVEKLPEKLIDAGCALFGCGPAFVYLFLEALADGAVACGLPREQALRFAAATVEGAAATLRATGKHPGELKDAVTSPGGSTIEGVRVLEEGAFRGTVMDAVTAAYEKTVELGK